MTGKLFFNGIDSESGDYFRQPEDMANLEVAVPRRKKNTPMRGLPPHLNGNDLSQAGWGIITTFARKDDILTALEPLLTRRRMQAGFLYKEMTYDSGTSALTFITDHKMGLDLVDPEIIPYFLLLVGTPGEIPFSFQYGLGAMFSVGRLPFADTRDLALYAANQESWETNVLPLQKPTKARFFGISHPGEELTRISNEYLVRPLSKYAKEKLKRHWIVETTLDCAATKKQLLIGINCPETSFIFTAGHGLVTREGGEIRQARQGALICADWPGPGKGVKPNLQHLLTADDLPLVNLNGKIAFFFACFSAGTTAEDAIFKHLAPPREEIAASLPQAMLRHGAQAVIGHVDQAYGLSFLWGDRIRNTMSFRSMLWALAEGSAVGLALSHMTRRFTEITGLAQTLEDGNHEMMDRLVLAASDARNYVLIGDPVVRLPAVPLKQPVYRGRCGISN